MEYKIHSISLADEIDSCPVFYVNQYNWGGSYRPVTYGRLAFLPGTGFLVKMVCEEKNPVRTYTEPNSPVHLDSAMEAFFQFYPQERPACYLNFEANANGALHAKYGDGRKNRLTFPKNLHEACNCRSRVFEDCWTLELTVPLSLISYVYGHSDFSAGSLITCNFYKIKESEGNTHFASFTRIDNETPDFHLPAYFAKAILFSEV